MSKRLKIDGDSNSMSRRKFLQCLTSMPLLGLSTSPAAALFSTILGGIGQKAWAAETGLSVKRMLYCIEGGAPARWPLQLLTAYGSAGFNRNSMLGSQFVNVGGRAIGVEWATQTVPGGVKVPTMWTFDLPTPDNGSRPMSDLLQYLLVLQGITTKNGGHESSQQWNWLPTGGTRSSSAFSADFTTAPFSAINVNASGYEERSFKSQANKTFLNASTSGNMLSSLLNPFTPAGSAQFKSNRTTIRSAYDKIFPLLDDWARKGHVGAEAVIQNRNSALQLVETNFTNLGTVWTTLLAKYTNLVSRAIFSPSTPLPGINDLPVGEGGSGAAELYQIDDGQTDLNLHLLPDLRAIVTASTTVNSLASSFAFAEYVLLNNLTYSLACGFGGLSGLVHPVNGQSFSMGNDQHTTGLYPHMLLNTLRFRAIMACLLELITQLDAADIFKDTVVCMSGEFNRNPRDDGTGSDHGWTGKSIELYSKNFNGPIALGNLKNDENLGWGAGGNVAGLGRQLDLVDTMVTLAHLIGAPAPFTSANSLVTATPTGLIPNIELSRWV